MNYKQLLIAFFTNIFFLPAPPQGFNSFLFHLNLPTWSISLELLVNILFVISIKFLRKTSLYFFTAFTFILLLCSAVEYHSLIAGATWFELPCGVARVGFGFFMGVTLNRLERQGQNFPPWMSVLLPIIVFVSFLPNLIGTLRIFYDLICVGVVYPSIVISAAHARTSEFQQTAFKWLGAISYPLYLFHMPVIYIVAGLSTRVLHGPLEPFRPYTGLGFCLVAIAAAAFVSTVLDVPVQRLLHRDKKG